MSIPGEVTVAIVDDELPGLLGYLNRHGWQVEWSPLELRLAVTGRHPKDGVPVRIVAALDGYRALPPAWTFEDPTGGRGGASFFPRAGSIPDGRSSIFHGKGVICAPFNRLAYKTLGGPHGDWGGPEKWLEVNVPSQVRAIRLANMFAVILGHLTASPGMS